MADKHSGKFLRVELTSAHIPSSLAAFQKYGIELWNLRDINELRVTFWVRYADRKKILSIAKSRGEEISISGPQGAVWMLLGLRSRPILALTLLILLVLTLWLPRNIVWIQVEGNSNVPTKLILEKAANAGIFVGAKSGEIRTANLKNQLLLEIPELKWAGVRIVGCTAVITVQERQLPEKEDLQYPVSSIVSVCDGLVASVVTQSGTAMCAPGDAVHKGQVLISGYMDQGQFITGGNAEGEVFAYTNRSVKILQLHPEHQNVTVQTTQRRFALQIGKKRINFYKCSGILPPTCARIYSVFYMTLPGGYTLPISLCMEQWISMDFTEKAKPVETDLSEAAQQYLLDHILAGEILSALEQITQTEEFFFLQGTYSCREQIGITRNEENLDRLWEK